MNFKNNNINMTLRGYVQNKKFGPYCLPVPFQNKLLKQYCEEKNLNFALPQGEIVFSQNFIQLRSLIKKLKSNEGIVMMSIYMLPDLIKTRKKIVQELIKKKIECHFIVENKIAKNKRDFDEIENILKILLFQKDNIRIFKSIKR